MYNTVEELPQLKLELTFGKFVVIIASLFLFFVLPIYTIETYTTNRNNSESEETAGRVAGVSTDTAQTEKKDSIITIPILNEKINLSSQSGMLFMLGIVLIGISTIIILYILIDHLRYQKYH